MRARVAIAVLLLVALGCGGKSAHKAEVAPSAAQADAIVAAVRSRPQSPLATPLSSGFDAAPGGFKPRFTPTAGRVSARVVLPARASGFFHLEDVATGASAEVSLDGARDVAAASSGGYLVYANAHASGATLLHRAVPSGSEDFLSFETRPGATAISYRLQLGKGIAGLRFVAGVLELVDAGGAPRLRVDPPYIVGADGARTDAVLAVEGCAFDRSPAAPWGRKVTAPGARTCTVRVSWRGDGVRYPAVLDPLWTTTGTMVAARTDHTATLLSTGRVLVVGGHANLLGTTGLATAELYDPATNTWAATGSLTGTTPGRWSHTATQLNTGLNGTTSGKVLIAGGINGSASVNTAQLYTVTGTGAGAWAAAGNLDAARHLHTATVLANGKVLVAGGMNGNTILNTAAIYDPTSGSGSWTAVSATMASPRRLHTATLLSSSNPNFNNKVLIVGGNAAPMTTTNGVELFDSATSTWSTTTTLDLGRESHTATLLPNGNVLVTGGMSGLGALDSAAVFTIPASGSAATWSDAWRLTAPRWAHTAILLPTGTLANGQVLLAGGDDATGPTDIAELWDGASTWTATASLQLPVKGQTGTLLSNHMVLIAGGFTRTGLNAVATSQVYDPSLGSSCTSGSQCASGFCVSGVCCDTACTDQCSACNLPGSAGTCTFKEMGTSCDDGNGCTYNDICLSGVCFGPDLITCPAPAYCYLDGTCNPSTGFCSWPTAPNGTSCDDFDACTNGEACQSGTCAGGTTVTCTTDQCHDIGACDPGTGCPAPTNKTNGSGCSDGNACTQTDTCQAGACTGGNPIVCTASNACHVAGTCNPSTGVCSNPNAPDGTNCNDGDACTYNDTCLNGICFGPYPVTCPAPAYCYLDGTCNPSTGFCSWPIAPNGTSCDDFDACTNGEACQNGTCAGGTAVTCTTDQCHDIGACDPGTGCPAPTNKTNGTACSDGNACTQTDTCQAGACTGANAMVCTAGDACHAAGVCDPVTGTCSNPALGGSCSLGAFDYDKAGRLIRDRGAELQYDAYDQLREVLPIASPPPITNLPVEALKMPGDDATQTLANHSNSRGHVPVTAVLLPQGVLHTLLFKGNGSPEDLNATLGIATSISGGAMNDNDAVAGGWLPAANTGSHAFRYDETGFHDLGNPGAFTSASDINNANQVVGFFSAGGKAHGYRHSDATGFQEIGTLGGAESWGWRIDDLGVVSASAQTPNSPSTGTARFGHAALYHDVIGLEDLNAYVDPMSGTTLVIANEKQGDWVVGVAMEGGAQRAYRLKLSTRALDDIGWAGWSSASSVNAAGDAVGWGYLEASNTTQSAWILSERTGFAKLNDLIDPASGWDLRVPSGIDDFGDVVGWGYYNGVVSAFRLRIPAHSSGTGGPMVAEVHTYGYDGLRTSTTTAPRTENANTQFWITQDYTQRNGVREHYIRVGDRLIARLTTQPADGSAAGVVGAPPKRTADVKGREWLQIVLAFALMLAAVAGAALGFAKRRRRWVPAFAGFAALLFGAASCEMLGFDRGGGALAWSIATDLTHYFHSGIAPGPTLITDTNGALVEERRYEPFGQPIPTVNVVAEPQNILGKLTDPNTGWSYHGARWMQPQTARWTAPDPAIKGPDAKFLVAPWDIHPYQFVNQSPTRLWDPDGQDSRSYIGTKFHETYDRLWHENMANCSFFCTSSRVDPLQDQVEGTYYQEHPDDPEAHEYWSKRAWGDVTERASKEITYGYVGGWIMRLPGISWLVGKTVQSAGWVAGKAVGAGRAVFGKAFTKGAQKAATRGAGCPGCPCFVPGTLVLMADGSTKSIEEVEVGDWVLAVDPKGASEPQAHQVTGTMENFAERVIRIEMGSEREPGFIEASGEHPFWTIDNGWVGAAYLQVGDRLLDANGGIADVVGVAVELYETPTHNLTVDGVNTYFVVAGDHAVLVHNQEYPLGDGYTARTDAFNTGGRASFEIHVFDPKHNEVGVHGETEWIHKHGHKTGPALPENVQNQLRGRLIDENRALGNLPAKGRANIKGDNWKALVKKACP